MGEQQKRRQIFTRDGERQENKGSMRVTLLGIGWSDPDPKYFTGTELTILISKAAQYKKCHPFWWKTCYTD
jgi:hypothetical protein